MAARRGKARHRILESATALTRERGAESVSVEAVAKAAGSAKGLVHYHFKTKQGLLSSVAELLLDQRTSRWKSAFETPSANEALERSWSLLVAESADGTVRAWQSLVGAAGRLTGGLANRLRAEFAECLAGRFSAMLRNELGLTPTIPDAEIGRLVGAVVDGMGFQLAAGTEPKALEGAYSAAWLAMLSLTRPAD